MSFEVFTHAVVHAFERWMGERVGRKGCRQVMFSCMLSFPIVGRRYVQWFVLSLLYYY